MWVMPSRAVRRRGNFDRRLAVESLEQRRLLAAVTLQPVKDATLFEDALGQTANGAGDFLFAGRTAEGVDSIRRGLLQFDVAAAIPAGSTIRSASLQLNMSRSIAGPEAVSVHPVLAAWSEGTANAGRGEGVGADAQPNDVTWVHRQYNTQFWSAPGGDYEPAASASTTVAGGGSYTWTSAELAGDVQSWLDGPATNFGWLLRGNESTGTTAKRFDSRENPAPANRPQLIIEYDPPAPRALSIGDVSLEEGDTGTTNFAFEVTLSRASSETVTVNYATRADTAASPDDFLASSGTLQFEPGGALTQMVVIAVHGDLAVEQDEQFFVDLADAVNATIEKAAGQGTILNDDAPAQHPWQNGISTLDVNNDGFIVPLDALLIINDLNSIGARALPVPPTAEFMPPPFLDTSGDDFVSPIDALLVINFLNAQAGVGAQGGLLEDAQAASTATALPQLPIGPRMTPASTVSISSEVAFSLAVDYLMREQGTAAKRSEFR